MNVKPKTIIVLIFFQRIKQKMHANLFIKSFRITVLDIISNLSCHSFRMNLTHKKRHNLNTLIT